MDDALKAKLGPYKLKLKPFKPYMGSGSISKQLKYMNEDCPRPHLTQFGTPNNHSYLTTNRKSFERSQSSDSEMDYHDKEAYQRVRRTTFKIGREVSAEDLLGTPKETSKIPFRPLKGKKEFRNPNLIKNIEYGRGQVLDT